MSRLSAACSWAISLLFVIVFSATLHAAPVCQITDEVDGPPLRIEFRVQENTVGLQSITITKKVNATVTIPQFPPGTVGAITFAAFRTDANADFEVEFVSVDINGGQTVCGKAIPPIGSQAPNCQVTSENPGPPFSVQFTIQDSDDGLNSIQTTSELNASVDIPGFTQGTNAPVVVTATQVNENQNFSVALLARDVGDNTTACSYSKPVPGDDAPPECELTSEDAGPPFQVQFTISDSESGLNTITAKESFNVQVDIPAFTPGTTADVVVTVTQVNAGLDFSVVIESVDVAGNTHTCRYPLLNVTESRPEFDTVGDDSQNFFRDYYQDLVIVRGTDASGFRINTASDFSTETFTGSFGSPSADVCFSTANRTYESILTTSLNAAEYVWDITLQMSPLYDMVLDVVACVLESGADDPWTKARAAGQFRYPWAPNRTLFVPSSNPGVTVEALPGPFATPGFPQGGFFLDARKLPGLELASLTDRRVNLQTLVDQGIVMAVPQTGNTNSTGQTAFALNRGDRIRITLSIPSNNSADIRLGSDNAVLKYIGIIGTEHTAP